MTDKQTQDNLQLVNFRMTSDEIARLDRMALECGVTRSQMLRNLVTTDMDEYALLKKVGIMRAAITIRDILGWMADKAKHASQDIDKDKTIKA